MSTHNIGFHEEIRKKYYVANLSYPQLCIAMHTTFSYKHDKYAHIPEDQQGTLQKSMCVPSTLEETDSCVRLFSFDLRTAYPA